MKIKAYIKRKVNQFLALFPSRLPLGLTEHADFLDALKKTYNLATDNDDSIAFVVDSLIMRLGPTVAYKSKFYFYLSIQAGAAKQVAGYSFETIKIKQRAEAAAAQQAATSNATPTQ